MIRVYNNNTTLHGDTTRVVPAEYATRYYCAQSIDKIRLFRMVFVVVMCTTRVNISELLLLLLCLVEKENKPFSRSSRLRLWLLEVRFNGRGTRPRGVFPLSCYGVRYTRTKRTRFTDAGKKKLF